MTSIFRQEILFPALCNEVADCDLFICSSGSDPRCISAIEQILNTSGRLCAQQLVVEFTARTVAGGFVVAENHLPNASVISGSFGLLESILVQIPDHLPDGGSVVIDISGFTKPFLFVLLKLLKQNACISECIALYTEPLHYQFGIHGFTDYSSTEGPLITSEIPGYGGITTRKREDYLVVLAGFDGELASYILEDLAPDETLLVNGFPSYQAKFKDISLINNEKILGTLSYENELYYVDANNPFHVYNLLNRMSLGRRKSVMSLAPLGSKPMALGAALYAIENDEVRVVYPSPKSYREATSSRSLQTWFYELSPVICPIPPTR